MQNTITITFPTWLALLLSGLVLLQFTITIAGFFVNRKLAEVRREASIRLERIFDGAKEAERNA